MLVLGIDPGTAITGYGLVDGKGSRKELVAYGVLETSPKMNMPERLLKIGQDMTGIIEEHRPDSVAIEQLFYHRNAKTLVPVAQSRGVLIYAAVRAGLPVAEYTPLQVKQSITGYGQAEKKQVQAMVKQILNLSVIPRPDDAADALAIAICHLHSHRISSILKGKLP